jgi:uncharacterized protein
MKLSQLAELYHDFYAPAFVVRVAGRDLRRDLFTAVSQVEVDLKLGATSQFSFTVSKCYDYTLRKFRSEGADDLLAVLKFGAKVEIRMGYRDDDAMPVMLRGVITGIAAGFPEGGSPELSVSGMDDGFSMTIGKNSRNWSKTTDSDVVDEIVSTHNLDAKVKRTLEERAQIEQNQTSDWEFLKTLADRNNFELYIDETATLHFAPRNTDASGVVELVYGEGLLSFKPEANLAEQVARVEVYGYDAATAKVIIGVAGAGEEQGKSGESAAQVLGAFVRDPKKRPTLRLRQPVFTQSEAKQRATAELNHRSRKFLTGDGETIGLPLLRPDRNIALKNLPERFAKTYFVEQTVHKIDASGYRTRFKIQEPAL